MAAPEPIKDGSLTTLKEKLIKIGAKVASHAHCRVPNGWGGDALLNTFPSVFLDAFFGTAPASSPMAPVGPRPPGPSCSPAANFPRHEGPEVGVDYGGDPAAQPLILDPLAQLVSVSKDRRGSRRAVWGDRTQGLPA
jgi:hypothetical protein